VEHFTDTTVVGIQGLDKYPIAGFPYVNIVLDTGNDVLVFFGEYGRECHLFVANVYVLYAGWQFERLALSRHQIVNFESSRHTTEHILLIITQHQLRDDLLIFVQAAKVLPQILGLTLGRLDSPASKHLNHIIIYFRERKQLLLVFCGLCHK